MAEFNMIPSEALKGFHIHYKHTVPNPLDEIPWTHVFAKIASLRKDVTINPEILQKNQVKAAIEFCRQTLKGSDSRRCQAARGVMGRSC